MEQRDTKETEFEWLDLPRVVDYGAQEMCTYQQRRELEKITFEDKSYGGYSKMLARCSLICERTINSIGTMKRSEIALVLKTLKQERKRGKI